MRAAAFLLAWLAASLAWGQAREPLVIETGSAKHAFQVEFAATPEQKSRGLMFRERMAPDHGMLFDFRPGQHVAMWMRNTLIPLDMLFILSDGRIRNIHKRAVPHSEATIASDGAVAAVLEINGGAADRLGIAPGDLVRHRLFGNLP
ncbi:MAG: DUF192 domain-containing protein [Alphaproteobacteria bacterium]|nr:DUF192 domain-containing protein [Alphaproteobacteria bacterium]